MVKKEKENSNDFISSVKELSKAVGAPMVLTLIISGEHVVFDSVFPNVSDTPDDDGVDDNGVVIGPEVALKARGNNYIG